MQLQHHHLGQVFASAGTSRWLVAFPSFWASRLLDIHAHAGLPSTRSGGLELETIGSRPERQLRHARGITLSAALALSAAFALTAMGLGRLQQSGEIRVRQAEVPIRDKSAAVARSVGRRLESHERCGLMGRRPVGVPDGVRAGWFRIQCPRQRLPEPEIEGRASYRVS